MARNLDRADRRLHQLVGLVVLLGVAAVVVSSHAVVEVLQGQRPAPAWSTVVVIVVLVAIGNLVNVEVRVRSTRHGMSWADAAVLVGLGLLPVAWVVIATVVSTAVANMLMRRPPMKLAFNVAKEAVTAFVGGLVLIVIGTTGLATPPGVGPDAASLASLALAFLAMNIADPLQTVPVIAAASRTKVIDRLRANWDIRLVTNAGRLAVALGAVLLLEAEPTLIYALPLAVLLGHLWHERWVRAREERQAWQDLAAATEAFTGVDLDVVLHAAVTRGTKLFSADELEVEVWLGDEERLVRGADEIVYDGSPADAPADAAHVYAVGLHGRPGRRDIGALRLRFRSRMKVAEREEAMVASYAAALETAVRNAAVYRQLDQATKAHAHAAAHDALTGLPNRRELERQLAAALATPNGMDCRIAVMLMDLRHFKEVNDSLGHLAGDRVLAQVAQRLSGAVGANDLVARFGGDEFAVVLRNAWRPARVEARGRRVLASLADPIEVDGLPIIVEANGGLALAVDPQDEPDTVDDDADPVAPAYPRFRDDPQEWLTELMRRADVALYQARRTSQPLVCYTTAGDPADRERLTLAGQLPRAVSQREFVLHFQPIVDLTTGEVVGAEALARWRHPTRGQLEPRWFLDLLERSAQLSAFTAAVLDDSLEAANLWRAAGYDLQVSVNISSRSLLDATLPRQVLEALDRHHTRPDRLCLELTETLALSQLETVDRVLTQLHDIGVRLALDDFGTGFSSLAVLSRISVHALKIDRSFVQALQDVPTLVDPAVPAAEPAAGADAIAQAKAVVRSTAQLGRTLDLTVVAEGVEADLQRRLLWELGCTLGQGHLFARPQPADLLLAQLTLGVAGRSGALALPLHGDAAVSRLRPVRPADPATTADGGP